jgi:hypothetical protein
MRTITLKQRAVITPEFINALVEMSKTKLRAMAEARRVTPSHIVQYWDEKNLNRVAYLKTLISDKDFLDKQITRLKMLKIANATLINNGTLLAIQTEPITMLSTVIDNKTQKQVVKRSWEAGSYTIYLPIAVAFSGLTTGIGPSAVHFVPDEFPGTQYRHPHHHADVHTENIDPNAPYRSSSSTCWGDFGPTTSNAVTRGDYIDLVRLLTLYIERVNERSIYFVNGYHGEEIIRRVPNMREIR